MSARIAILLVAAAALSSAASTAAQIPPGPSPGPVAATAPSFGETFPPGAEVLSVDGEPLGRLAEVETRAGGERILHIRRADGSMTSAPAVVASRGERAIVLEWTRTEFESVPAPATGDPAGLTATPPLL